MPLPGGGRNDRDKEGGLQTVMEEEGLKIECETMEEWRERESERAAGSLKGAARGGSSSLEKSRSGRNLKK